MTWDGASRETVLVPEGPNFDPVTGYVPALRRVNDWVEIIGMVRFVTGTWPGAVLATVPDGYRPSTNRVCAAVTSNGRYLELFLTASTGEITNAETSYAGGTAAAANMTIPFHFAYPLG